MNGEMVGEGGSPGEEGDEGMAVGEDMDGMMNQEEMYH